MSDVNRNIPTTWKWVRGDPHCGLERPDAEDYKKYLPPMTPAAQRFRVWPNRSLCLSTTYTTTLKSTTSSFVFRQAWLCFLMEGRNSVTVKQTYSGAHVNKRADLQVYKKPAIAHDVILTLNVIYQNKTLKLNVWLRNYIQLIIFWTAVNTIQARKGGSLTLFKSN